MAETITKEQNIAYLEKGLYYSGFGIEANKPLNEHIGKKVPEFSIPVDMHVAGKDMAFRLDFRQSEKEPNMYFFNGYQATLKEDATKTQFFSISKNHGITAREAVNLLEGRAVAKLFSTEDKETGETRKMEMWTSIDFSKKKENGNFERKAVFPWDGFDINRALETIAVNQEIPAWKLASLKKGNLVSHEVVIDGKELTGTMVVNLPFKTVDVFDDKGVRVFQANGNTLHSREVMESWDEKIPAHGTESKKTPETPPSKIPERTRRPKKETSATENAPSKGVRR